MGDIKDHKKRLCSHLADPFLDLIRVGEAMQEGEEEKPSRTVPVYKQTENSGTGKVKRSTPRGSSGNSPPMGVVTSTHPGPACVP